MIKIYIAAKFSRREYLRSILPDIERRGFQVTSQWLDDQKDFPLCTDEELEGFGWRDVEDVKRADQVVIDSIHPLSEGAGGGREFEGGMGLIYHGGFWLVGPARNVFHKLAVRKWNTWEEFLNGN